MNYPVVSEHVLGVVSSRLWSRRRREDVPPLLPGTVHVFRVGGEYRQYPEGLVFDPGHADVLDASSVSLIDTRVRVVDVRRTVPSVSEADQFTVSVSFSCQVTDPALIARQGVVDVTVPLRAYLAGEDDLPRVSAGYRVEEVNAVRAEAARWMTAYSTVVPPRVSGMSVEFVGVEVYVADELRAWEQKLREQRRSHELLRGQNDFESYDAQRIAELLAQGSDYADAIGIVRERVDVADVAARIHGLAAAREARAARIDEEKRAHAEAREMLSAQTQRDLILELVRQMGAEGTLSDPQPLLEELVRQGASRSGANPALDVGGTRPSDEPRPAPRSLRSAQTPEDDFVKDEDDFVD
ncbi:hypothetical protein [Streptomyces sp. CBMA29]|uniref:hypothetical protein n=1 Tax=Streptomyces sp. CBMA29 TaxID=1896314 RepID=UPI001661EE7E|nr:hypothetical protein [Streptomyces sp. CBMA29]MBD0739381.1 hypothetical protein [Streptomyces sp. CBMA29]